MTETILPSLLLLHSPGLILHDFYELLSCQGNFGMDLNHAYQGIVSSLKLKSEKNRRSMAIYFQATRSSLKVLLFLGLCCVSSIHVPVTDSVPSPLLWVRGKNTSVWIEGMQNNGDYPPTRVMLSSANPLTTLADGPIVTGFHHNVSEWNIGQVQGHGQRIVCPNGSPIPRE